MNATQKKIEDLLNLATENRKLIEIRLKETQQELSRLQFLFEEDINNLKSAQAKENLLQEELYEIQKQSIKQAISIVGIKKVFGDATPFFLRVKEKALNKVQEVKDYIDGTSLDKKWVDERYKEYKELCISKGEKIKNKEEFQNIALALREPDDSTTIYEKMVYVSNKFGTAKDSIKSIWQIIGLEEKMNNFLTTDDVIEFPISNNKMSEQPKEDKKTVFQDWINNRNIKRSAAKTEIIVLYDDYIQFIQHVHGEDNLQKLSYTFKSGAFTTALQKKFKKLSQEVNTESGRKKVGIKINNN